MNERLLEAKKNAEKFKEYLQSDSKKEVRKFAEELITHKDNIDFVSILEDALTLYDFIAWKKESVPAETRVSLAEPKHCINCKHLTHEIDEGYPFDYCHYFDITIIGMTKHFCAKFEARSN